MGWTVLYIAFGIVALWLLGEVLLQYKARLRWRVLAFTGFLCVVAGALIPSVPVIGAGIAAFATGQTFVTLSYRRGFVAGWALTGVPGVSRRRDEPKPEPEPEPAPGPQFDPVEAPEPVPALASGGYGPDSMQQGGFDSGANGYDTAAFAAVDSMSAPEGFNAPNGYDTGSLTTVDAMGLPNGNRYEGGGNGGNRYEGGGNRYEGGGNGGNRYEGGGNGGNRYEGAANGYDTAAFSGMDAFAGSAPGGGMGAGPGPNGFEATQAFSPFSPETEGYRTGSFQAGGYGPQDTGQQQVPVYQPGPLPDETGEYGFGAYGGYDSSPPGIYNDGSSQPQYAAFSDPYAGADFNGAGAPSYGNGYGGYDAYDPYGGYNGFGDQQGYGPQQSPYGVSDTFGGGAGMGAGGAGADAYGSMYGNGETYADGQSYFPQPPTGGAGAWVPQQRDPNQQMQPEQQGYPYQNGDPYGYGTQGNGYGNGYY